MRRILVALAVALSACRHAPPKVAAGDPAIVQDVRLEQFEVLPDEVRDTLRDDLPIRPGISLTEEAEQAAGQRAVEILQDHGYPYAQVRLARQAVEPGRVEIVLRAEPGNIGFFGPIDIAGNRKVDDAIIRRRVAYSPGDLFRRSAIERTQQRIGALGLFKSVEVRALNADKQPADVATLITVEERTPWHWNVGLGYAAGERVGIDARISHLNFLGSARRLDLQGRISRVERTGEVLFTQADAWHPSLSLSLQARHQEIDERSFLVQSRGGQAAVTWQWTTQFASTVSYAASRERSDVASGLDVLLGLQDGMLSAWSIDLDHRKIASGSSTNSPVTRTLSLHAEQAGGWMPGTFNYVKVTGEMRQYRRLFDGRLVLAGRAKYGAVDPARDESDIPLLKRFFLGGSGEMRGWGLYELSPLSASGEPVGGRSTLMAAGEARLAINKRITGALFIEAGNVWPGSWAVRLGDLLYDAGPGVRIGTPFGLIRLDLGYQLKTLDGLRIDGHPQKRRWRISIGIGEAF